jgi:hypothetical protein
MRKNAQSHRRWRWTFSIKNAALRQLVAHRDRNATGKPRTGFGVSRSRTASLFDQLQQTAMSLSFIQQRSEGSASVERRAAALESHFAGYGSKRAIQRTNGVARLK